MENAVDALKIAFAVFVFAIAVALTFSIVGQARATSDTILAINDKTSDYEYVDENDVNANQKDRIVGFETILPTIYRYAKEQYAVTILDKDGTPIVRYDLYTEGFMGDWDDIIKRQNTNTATDQDKQRFKAIKERIGIIDEFIEAETGNKNMILNSLFTGGGQGRYEVGTLYKGTNDNNTEIKTVAPWMGNPNTDAILRIQADFGAQTGEATKKGYYKKNGITYNGKKLSSLKDATFEEKFLEIQTSGTTITELDEENNIEYSLETVKGNKKLEIIYIMQKQE